MKIVILDGHAINPGDLSWDALRRLGSFRCFAEGLAVTLLSRYTQEASPAWQKTLLSWADRITSVSCFRSRTALGAEVLFLRKQLPSMRRDRSNRDD